MVQLTQFVAAVSASIGLLCYALSSSFNNLLGSWNPSKIITYYMSGSAICLAILFPSAWQHYLSVFPNQLPMNFLLVPFAFLFIKMLEFLSRIFQNQAHTRFFVLTLTTLYSYYSDEEASNGKPDPYSPVSWAAFAAMSFCLSSYCAFDDLMYFFSGLLILELMDVELLLGFVGLLFSFFLIILLPHFHTLVQYLLNRHVLPQNEKSINDQVKSSSFVFGLISAAIGITCYTLSSSFKNQFGEWKKFSFFSGSSFMVHLTIVFRVAWQPYVRFSRYMDIYTYLFLSLPIVYSLFMDIIWGVKLDAYGLISFASFATMSLCMPNRVFSGSLLFMRIFLTVVLWTLFQLNLLLAVVGIGFMYFLSVVRVYLEHVWLEGSE